ncbi:thiamine phosphate synthase [Lyngbya confervoides]|uniref:Thiamine-phosphate synthase n=1 Tax=Lyngbya confervoides BDU141951 TaxID=1574623 RepID=A0ABD4T4Y4_9CYAN|nr:thiamine phosphate synthase [Lyngbya confervoides]MCM1983716.1 thiamine phosphate synthase [Lyngbya confervoides BDU141951]
MTTSPLFRILDANLDRAREGLRVIEEWCRFGLENADWAKTCKDLRQALAQLHQPEFRAARDTPADVGTQITHAQEQRRDNLEALLLANFARIQEALRVLEEYGKLADPELAGGCKTFRYQVYALESQVLAATGRSDSPKALGAGARQSRLQRLQAARLYLVTSPQNNLFEIVESALQGGVRLVQYREKHLPDCDRLNQAIQLRALCHRYKALFIVNDRVDLAYGADADGVHLGQQDVPMHLARSLLGADRIVGRSTTNPEEMARAIQEGADYIGVGPIFTTPTKAGKAAVGFDYIQYAQDHAPMPWYAIGGINAANLPQVQEAGAQRVAVVRAIMEAAQPDQVTAQLRQLLDS